MSRPTPLRYGDPARPDAPEARTVSSSDPTAPLVADLSDGGRLLLRPLTAEDRWRLEEGLQRLSERSRYLRFHAPVKELSQAQLDRLTDVDGRDHLAWLALDADDPDGLGWGVARCFRLPDDPHVAEAAVTVLDEHQGRGIGSALLVALEREAWAVGIRTFRTYVLAENAAMLHVFEELGARREREGGSVYRVDVDLRDDAPSPAGLVLREVARRPRGVFAFPLAWVVGQVADVAAWLGRLGDPVGGGDAGGGDPGEPGSTDGVS